MPSLCLDFFSRGIIILRFLLSLSVSIGHSFLLLVFHDMVIPQSVHPFTCCIFGLFPGFTYYEKAAMNVCV